MFSSKSARQMFSSAGVFPTESSPKEFVGVLPTESFPKEPSPFTQEGAYDDEITLDFEEDKKLYVPKNFLSVVSPVFDAMFKNDFKEKREKRVKMNGKSYEDFLEFLLCLHPRMLNEVNKMNVLRIVPFADEYQVTAFLEKCKTAMKSTVLEALNNSKNQYRENHLRPLRECLKVLETAISLNYTDVCDFSVGVVAKFGYILYNDVEYRSDYYDMTSRIGDGKETYGDVRKECISKFASLPLEWQNKILLNRLEKIDTNDLRNESASDQMQMLRHYAEI